jgi:hypothetical protein
MDKNKRQVIVLVGQRPEYYLGQLAIIGMTCDEVAVQFTEQYRNVYVKFMEMLRGLDSGWVVVTGPKEEFSMNPRCAFKSDEGLCLKKEVTNIDRCRELIRLNCSEHQYKYKKPLRVQETILNK